MGLMVNGYWEPGRFGLTKKLRGSEFLGFPHCGILTFLFFHDKCVISLSKNEEKFVKFKASRISAVRPAQNWFHVKSEVKKNSQISTHSVGIHILQFLLKLSTIWRNFSIHNTLKSYLSSFPRVQEHKQQPFYMQFHETFSVNFYVTFFFFSYLWNSWQMNAAQILANLDVTTYVKMLAIWRKTLITFKFCVISSSSIRGRQMATFGHQRSLWIESISLYWLSDNTIHNCSGCKSLFGTYSGRVWCFQNEIRICFGFAKFILHQLTGRAIYGQSKCTKIEAKIFNFSVKKSALPTFAR